MARFNSFKMVPAETRQLLRERFRRHLRVHRNIRPASDARLIPDEAMLRLFLGMRLVHENDFERAKTAYTSIKGDDEPDIDQLVAQGWLSVSWGHISIPFDIAQVVRREASDKRMALRALIDRRFERAIHFAPDAQQDAELLGLIPDIEKGALRPENLACITPSWVAARLWDRTGRTADVTEDLRVWADKWGLLGYPELIAFRAWNSDEAVAFRDAVLEVLQRRAGLVPWSQLHDVLARRLAIKQGQDPANFDNYIGQPPDSAVGRAIWVNQIRLEAYTHEVLQESIQGLARLSWLEVGAMEHGAAPLPQALEHIELSLAYPELFLNMMYQARQHPQLLADIAMHPPTAALACFWIAQWQSPSSAWERQLTDSDDRIGKTTAFADAVWLLGAFLKRGEAIAGEAAALLTWFHDNASRGYVEDVTSIEPLLGALRDMLAEQSEGLLAAVTDAVLLHSTDLTLGSGSFAALLDVVSIGRLEGAIDPRRVVNGYVLSLVRGDYRITAHRIGTASAATLYRIADRNDADREAFLYPLNIVQRLSKGVAQQANPYTLADEIGRSIRVHIRILCRAIAGLKSSTPAELIKALKAWVHAGAFTHKEKARISAFAPRFEGTHLGPSLDRPLAADLGTALAALPPADREAVLSEILETDEPLLLAQLLTFAPLADRDAIRKRLDGLSPKDAAEIYSLPEAQARIDALLAAGLGGAAARYMAAEQDLQTLGRTGGRDLARLRFALRLQFVNREWDAILATPEPKDLPPMEQEPAKETIRFFKAIAFLSRPDGNPAEAATIFSELYRRRATIAYASNLFAARIAVLLRGKPFAILDERDVESGRQALADIDQMADALAPVSDGDAEIVACNKALLYLALEEPDRAFVLLNAVRPIHCFDQIAAYSAVALWRMGRLGEAKSSLQDAVATYGDTPAITQAGAYFETGSAPTTAPLIVFDQDRLERMRAALSDFRLLDPPSQALVLSPKAEPFDDLIIDIVRETGAGLVSLAPMMRSANLDSNEDDITAVLREILRARVGFLGWSTPDQSKGGYSAKGNPGERDLLIMSGGTTLTVIEAVVCNTPPTWETTQKNLNSHFTKLLGYSTCKIFFHLTYAYVRDPGAILSHLESALKSPPDGFSFVGHNIIALTDSRPVGAIARYRTSFGEVKVVFLILDLAQSVQRDAAKAAAEIKTN